MSDGLEARGWFVYAKCYSTKERAGHGVLRQALLRAAQNTWNADIEQDTDLQATCAVRFEYSTQKIRTGKGKADRADIVTFSYPPSTPLKGYSSHRRSVECTFSEPFGALGILQDHYKYIPKFFLASNTSSLHSCLSTKFCYPHWQL
jgi:hypothetical protein